MDTVRIECEYLNTVNYVLHHNKLPVCRAIEVENVSDHAIENVRVRCSGPYITPYDSNAIASIESGERIRISQFNIIIDYARLATLTERVTTEFTITVTTTDEASGTTAVVGEQKFPIDLMPFDHWTGTRILPQTIASFVTPNDPEVGALVVSAAATLKELTGSSAFNAYATGDTNDVRRQVAAVFSAVHSLGIVYRAMPASFEEEGQRVSPPSRVIAQKMANCIELTLLMASVLEAVGINTIVIFSKGHAFLGVWLVDDSHSCSVSDDPAFIEKKCSEGIDEMLVVESTHAAQENATFEGAVSSARKTLADHEVFEIFVDVRRSRLERIFPLPTTIDSDGRLIPAVDGVDHNECVAYVEEHDRYDLSRLGTANKATTKFDIWERKLLDFSLRNSLLNISLRRRAIQLISFEAARIEDILQKGQECRILACPDVQIEVDNTRKLVKTRLHEELHDLIAADLDHNVLHTFLPEKDTRDTLKNIYRAARNALEETGSNSLFLAIGTVRWYETPQSTTPRHAPLLLLPVEMVYKKGSYHIRTRDEGITLNITLMEFMRQNYDIEVKGLDPLPRDKSGVDVALIFAILRDALKEQKGWDVDEECVLGTFSFSKFLMWNDINKHREQLTDNDIINSLVAGHLTWQPIPTTSDLKDLDLSIQPGDIALPVAADSSQMAAVIEGGNGNSFILYGPPGTGKSQTITNLIANALYHGKRVLFVAEKMAALSVVQTRLAKIGLDPFCLELHSNKSTKRHVLQQLEKARNAVHILAPEEHARVAEKILTERRNLMAYIDALHKQDPTDGLSVHACISAYETIGCEPMADFKFDKAIDPILLRDGLKAVEEMLGSRLEAVVRIVGQPSAHPLNGLDTDMEMLKDSDNVAAGMKQDAKALAEMNSDYDSLTGARELKEIILRDNYASILAEDPSEMRRRWREVRSKWFVPRYFARKKFIDELKAFNPLISHQEVEPLIENLISYRQKHDRIAAMSRIMEKYFKGDYPEDVAPEKSRVDAAVDTLTRWHENARDMRRWLHWTEFSRELREKGMGCVADALETSGMDVHAVKDGFLKALLKHKVDTKVWDSDILATFEGLLFDEKRLTYRKLTEDFMLLTQKELYARLASRVPRQTENKTTGSEIGLLNRNISSGGRGVSLRDLFDQLPTLLPRLCPCMLMSPMSVAQYLDIKADKFDLVVFDEASQMPTSEAVGAIARGKSLIVVGDPKQMPPTSFFSATNTDVEEAGIDDMESILEDCRTLEMPSMQLSWHYRSRHESLIAFSNNEYYDGELITFPSVDDRQTKVHFIPIEGQYDKGGSRSNRIEAEAIVDEIARRLQDNKLKKQSIGVIAFNVMQQTLIEDILQERLEGDKKLQKEVAELYEPIFVKNLENVQGDERDVILFSIGYGPDKNGKVSMNFGPLNNAGGERRLNVAVSRARCEMYVFSTISASDIDLRRSKAKGVEGLKHFLQYASTGHLPRPTQNRPAGTHPVIADQIAAELRKRGYTVAVGVGRSKMRVDVAVASPSDAGTYVLGILLDGTAYRDTPTTSDREVVQTSVLQSLDWNVMRVWSIDWFNNKEGVISRIAAILQSISTRRYAPVRKEPKFRITKADMVVEKSNERKCDMFFTDTKSVFSMSYPELIGKILEVEQPATLPYLCRRVSELRPSGLTPFQLQRSMPDFIKDFHTDANGDIWTNEEAAAHYSSYRHCTGRELAETPEAEMINVLIDTLNEEVAISETPLIAAGLKKLGFSRRSAGIEAAFKKVVEKMKASGTIESIGENLRLKI